MLSEYITHNPSQTKKIGENLANKIINQKKRESRARVLALQGELGGGKTTFLKGFAKGLGVKERILSPTFVILKKFKIKNKNFKFFYHLDCYRILKGKEILELGFKEIALNPKNIIAIEWSERIKNILPKKVILITFAFYKKRKRKITIKDF